LRVNAISRPFDTISGAFFWILCAVCIKSNTLMKTGVVYNDSDAFNKNSGKFNQNSKAFDAISGRYDALSGVFFWMLCAVCIK
jgi:hypothetical protein